LPNGVLSIGAETVPVELETETSITMLVDFDTTTGKLYYDPDSNGSATGAHFATPSNNPQALSYAGFAIV
jgi:hypothetical protein